MKSVLIGSVHSSRVVLEELIATGNPPMMVYSLDEAVSQNISGYDPIYEVAQDHGIPFRKFRKISTPEHVEELRQLAPDYLFVVGLSQLVGEPILQTAKQGVVGLHPTPLPKFRGRAAMVWQILLGMRESAITLFLIDKGMDSGPILDQEPFLIGEDDYAADMERSCLEALRRLCRRLFPQMAAGTVRPVPQDETQATYLLKRSPEDGLIDWSLPAQEIRRLIRATSHPYPGAFSHYDGKRLVTFWRADVVDNYRYIGFPGQIAYKEGNILYVLAGDGALLRMTEYDCQTEGPLLVGHRFRQKGEVR